MRLHTLGSFLGVPHKSCHKLIPPPSLKPLFERVLKMRFHLGAGILKVEQGACLDQEATPESVIHGFEDLSASPRDPTLPNALKPRFK